MGNVAFVRQREIDGVADTAAYDWAWHVAFERPRADHGAGGNAKRQLAGRPMQVLRAGVRQRWQGGIVALERRVGVGTGGGRCRVCCRVHGVEPAIRCGMRDAGCGML